MSHPYQRRLLKEFKSIKSSILPDIIFLSNESNLKKYEFLINIKNNLIYSPQDYFKLSIIITNEYPTDSPIVKFVTTATTLIEGDQDDDDDAIEIKSTIIPKIPIHPHIYSNGHICLNLLGDDWTPACTIESIVISIQSMLNNNMVLERPKDDLSYINNAPKNPKSTTFVYHDDTV